MDLDVERFATLFECYKPIERYLRLTGGPRAPGVAIPGPLDAFLMHQMAALFPAEPRVLDLAADATAGASAAFWASHSAVGGVRVRPTDQSAERPAWRGSFDDVMARMRVPPEACVLEDAPPFTSPAAAEPDKASHPPLPLFVCAAAPDTSAAACTRLLQQILSLYPEAVVLLMGVDRAGEGPTLEGVVSFCTHGSPYRVVLARELTPFFATSRLAVVCARGEAGGTGAVVDGVLRRIAGTFAGNFQFLSLVEAAVTAAQQSAAPPETPAALSNAVGAPRRQRQADPADYAKLVERIRQAVQEQLPADAVVLCVSKGDDALLELGGRKTRHFPEAEQGGYAGFHPQDDAAAIEYLERQRSRGAQFLLLPATSLWWFEHYSGFRQHLERHYRVALCRPETCIVFDVRGSAEVTAPASTKESDYARLVDRVRQVAARVVPRAATVAVVSKGDPALLSLDGPRAVHFPAAPNGTYAGYHPADAEQAMEFVDAARAGGARYLVFPATTFWWLDHYAGLRRYLETEARTVWADDACKVFELPTNGRARGRSGGGGTQAVRGIWGRIFGTSPERARLPGSNGSDWK